ncbi:MAG: hypothetical protein EHM28_01235 [Spirochaetaceae bacterium]|nr:MAG: hypothetical protein EHM28_01235 [Spirochaetaceae bacterium]
MSDMTVIILLAICLSGILAACATQPDKSLTSGSSGTGSGQSLGADQDGFSLFSGILDGFKFITSDDVVANTVKYSLLGIGGLVGAMLVGSAIKNRGR